MHKNNNEATGNYGIYQIIVDGITYKIGKADLDRITKATGDPTRIHQQIRKLRRKLVGKIVFYVLLETLLGYTTKHAKDVEYAILTEIATQLGYVPEGNKNTNLKK
jgi:hypothetical protein